MICNFKKKKERKEKIVISDETKWKNNGKTRGKGAKWWLFRDEMKNTEISLEVSWNQEFGKWRLGLFRGSIGRVSPNGQKLQIKRDSVERAASNGILASCGTRYYSLSLFLSLQDQRKFRLISTDSRIHSRESNYPTFLRNEFSPSSLRNKFSKPSPPNYTEQSRTSLSILIPVSSIFLSNSVILLF